MLRSVLQKDIVAELPLDLSENEIEVINYFKSSSLVLGRSGTGKTTCLTYKIVAQYLASRKVAGIPFRRQVSPKTCV